MLRISESGVYRLIRSGELRASRSAAGRCSSRRNARVHRRPREAAPEKSRGEQPAPRTEAAESNRNAVVLLSGGLDSTTALAIAQDEGFDVHALTFRYGQRHASNSRPHARSPQRRRRAARDAEIDLRMFGGSALTSDVDVPKGRDIDEMSAGIPVTYVPARNTVFLSFALAWAEVLADDIFIGVNALDYSRLPRLPARVHRGLRADGQPRHQARRRGPPLRIHTPLIDLTKARDHRARARTRRRLRAHPQLLRPVAGRRGLRRVRLLPAAAQGLRRERHQRPRPLPAARRPHDAPPHRATRSRARGRDLPGRSRSSARRSRAKAPRPGCRRHFVRLGGCDFRCSWCDTMYAVDPATVRANARSADAPTRSSSESTRLAGAPDWVTLSGGNPALHELGPLVERSPARAATASRSRPRGRSGATGSRDVDRLTISPKPPSSGMATAAHARAVRARSWTSARETARERARAQDRLLRRDRPRLGEGDSPRAGPSCRSISRPAPRSPRRPDLRDAVGERYRWLCERVAADPDLARARVLPQLHVIAWKDATGV